MPGSRSESGHHAERKASEHEPSSNRSHRSSSRTKFNEGRMKIDSRLRPFVEALAQVILEDLEENLP